MAGEGERRTELDRLRGFAILAVIGVHTIAFFAMDNELNLGSFGEHVLVSLVALGVPLFFIVSGIVLALRYRPPLDLFSFMKKRTAVVILPYIIISVAYILFDAYLGLRTVEISKVPMWLLTGNASFHFWFIVVLVQLYLLYPWLISALTKMEEKNRGWYMVLAFFVAQLIFSYIGNDISDRFITDQSLANIYKRIFLTSIFYFVLGIYIGSRYETFSSWIKRRSSYVVASMFALALLINVTWSFSDIGVKMVGMTHVVIGLAFAASSIIMCVFGTLFLFHLSASKRLKEGTFGRSIRALGECSFGIYLVHLMFISILVVEVFRIGDASADWLLFPILFVLVLILSFFTTVILSMMPKGQYIIGSNPRTKDGATSSSKGKRTIGWQQYVKSSLLNFVTLSFLSSKKRMNR